MVGQIGPLVGLKIVHRPPSGAGSVPVNIVFPILPLKGYTPSCPGMAVLGAGTTHREGLGGGGGALKALKAVGPLRATFQYVLAHSCDSQ